MTTDVPGSRHRTAGTRRPLPPAVGDARGLTALGGVAVALVSGALGGLVDVATGSGLRSVFAVCFVLGCGLTALLVHREDLVASVVMVPLVYVPLALAGALVENDQQSGGFATRQALELVNALVLAAPVLLAATGAALAVAVVRGVTGAVTGARTRRVEY